MPRFARSFVAAALLVAGLGAGCDSKPAPADPAGGDPTEPAAEAAFDPHDSAWATPVPPAKPPVPLRAYRRADDGAESPGQDMLERADTLKASGQYDLARTAYELALKQDPEFAQAAYQLACNEALAGNEAAARAAFARALELGYADYPIARADAELGPLREDADFPDRLREIRRRYLKQSAARVGTPFYVTPADLPDGTAENAGGGAKPPVILILHGAGDSHESFAREATAWAELGWAAVVVPGSLPTANGGFLWPSDEATGYAAVDRQLRAILKDPGLNAVADTSRAALMGFTQGANHAAALAALHPDRYAGAVALSPGGRPAGVYDPADLDPSRSRPIAMFYGDEEGGEPLLARWTAACQAAGWPVIAEEFPGGRHFPRDWHEERRTKVAAFLLGE
ncbi:alpha/beta hydrolase [Alienimonas sp. DA493]|uniref:alpha/beta hydrolase n=1 Tax=Alienimonas sp. DA493 TaxID=3373605 RepID=UPI0037545F99